jgi:hypothetical protein
LHVGTETVEGDVEMVDGEASLTDLDLRSAHVGHGTISCGPAPDGHGALAATRRWTIYIAQDKHWITAGSTRKRSSSA